jgi:pyrroline-5-carboxylate reductase
LQHEDTTMTAAEPIAFIGGGNMARSLIGGLVARGANPKVIRVSEPDAGRRDQLVRDFGVVVTPDNAEAARGAACVVLAVKPQVMAEVARALGPALAGRRVLAISIAAGIRIADLARWLAVPAALVRAMPNTPALIGAGITALVRGPGVDDAEAARAEALMAAAGETLWLDDEGLLDAVTAVSGSGPAYVFALMEAMEAAGIAQGLPADVARKLVIATVLGAARMAHAGGEPPALLRQRVTSPKGTTAAALDVLAVGGFDALIDRAIAAATRRGGELARELAER